MEQPLVSVIVPTYNRHEMLRNALRSLTLQETGNEFSYEIVVVDNGSTEPTMALVAEAAASSPVALRYVREEVGGYSVALNRCVRESRGIWVALFDDDQLADPDWLEELLSAASITNAKVVGGSIRLQLPTGTTALTPLCRGLLGEYVSDGTAHIWRPGVEVPYGGNVLIAREVFRSVGLFDTSMTLGGCDTDLVERALALGAIVSIAPAAVVRHVIPPYRVTPGYFRWTSMRSGCNLAHRDYKRFGCTKMISSFVANTAKAMLVNLPVLIFSVLTRNATESVHRKCLIWRAVGYARATASLATRRSFEDGLFISRLEFRKERATFPYEIKNQVSRATSKRPEALVLL